MRILPLHALVVIAAGALVSVHGSCSNYALLGCVLRLKAQQVHSNFFLSTTTTNNRLRMNSTGQVPFERNMLSVIFNIATEAKLLRTCRVYSNTMPCFRERIVACGDENQKRRLQEVGKMLMFICSPFSLIRQRQLIRHQRCISAVLAVPATRDCNVDNPALRQELEMCRENCAQQNSTFICAVNTWRSEQQVCTLQSLYSKCGPEAAGLYEQMQTTVFEPRFPVVCNSTFVPSPTNEPMPYIDHFPKNPVKPMKKPIPLAAAEGMTTTVTPTPTIRLKTNYNLGVKAKKQPQTSTVASTTAMNPSWPTVNTSPLIEIRPPWELTNPGKQQAMAPEVPKFFAAPTRAEMILAESSTTTAPRTIKMINILRRFLPEYMPQLTNILEQVHNPLALEVKTTTPVPVRTTLTYTVPDLLATTSPPPYFPSPSSSPVRNIYRMMPKLGQRSAFLFPFTPLTEEPTTVTTTPITKTTSSATTSTIKTKASSTTSTSVKTTVSTTLPTTARPSPVFSQFAGIRALMETSSTTPDPVETTTSKIASLQSSLFSSAQTTVPLIAPLHSRGISYMSALKTSDIGSAVSSSHPHLDRISLPALIKSIGSGKPIPAKELYESGLMPFAALSPEYAKIILSQRKGEVDTTITVPVTTTRRPRTKTTALQSQSFTLSEALHISSNHRNRQRWRPWYLGGSAE